MQTILFYESGYSIYVLRQASRRSWRIGQKHPVKVKFLAYAGTMQENCLRLMGKKLLVSLAMEGKFANQGLQALDDDDDILTAMARELVTEKGVGEKADALWREIQQQHTVKDLIVQGKVLHYGLSGLGPQTVRRAHAVHPLAAIQNEYSIMARDPEAQILPICKELGIGLVCWGPLAQGFLAGAIDRDTTFQPRDFRGSVPWFSPENRPANLAIVETLKDWAQRKKATPAQISLAWLLAQGPSVVPIPGTNKLPHLIDDLGGDAVKFTPEELRDLNAALNRTSVQGARMGQFILSLSNVEAPPKQ